MTGRDPLAAFDLPSTQECLSAMADDRKIGATHRPGAGLEYHGAGTFQATADGPDLTPCACCGQDGVALVDPETGRPAIPTTVDPLCRHCYRVEVLGEDTEQELDPDAYEGVA